MKINVTDILAQLLKKADKDAEERGITDYNEVITENAKYLVSHGVVIREKGGWKKSYAGGEHYECFYCKYKVRKPYAYFCPQCGSDLRNG